MLDHQLNSLAQDLGLDPLTLRPYDGVINEAQGVSNSQSFMGSSMNINGTAFSNKSMPTNDLACNSNAMLSDPTLGMSIIPTGKPLTVADMPPTFKSTFRREPHFDAYLDGSDSFEPVSQNPSSHFSSYSNPAFDTPELYRSPTSSSHFVAPSSANGLFHSTSLPAFQPSRTGFYSSTNAFPRYAAAGSRFAAPHASGVPSIPHSFSSIGPQDRFLLSGTQFFANNMSVARTTRSSCSTSYPVPAVGLPELYLSPVNSSHPVSPVSANEHLSTAATPQNCLDPFVSAGMLSQTQYMASEPYTDAQYSSGGPPLHGPILSASSDNVPFIPLDVFACTANASAASNSMTTTCFPSSFSAASSPSSPTSARQSTSRSDGKTGSSTIKPTRSKPNLVKPAKSKRLPCTVPDCNLRFFDLRSRNRHVASMHEHMPRSYCPGDCRKNGFSREDALKHHLDECEDDSKCVIEARKLGWSPNVKGSVKHLRSYTTRESSP